MNKLRLISVNLIDRSASRILNSNMAAVGGSEGVMSDSEIVRQVDSDISTGDELDLDSLNNEQMKIDRVLNYLMNFNCPKKKIGRPRKARGKPNASASKKSSSNRPSQQPEDSNEENIPDIRAIDSSKLMDSLTSVNHFNKKFLKGICALSKKVG